MDIPPNIFFLCWPWKVCFLHSLSVFEVLEDFLPGSSLVFFPQYHISFACKPAEVEEDVLKLFATQLSVAVRELKSVERLAKM